MAKNIKQREGFTIIEVVLVLAIAGLIFLMVFVALPTLRRSQRDTARRDDLSRVSAQLVQYQSNNNTKRYNLPGGQTPSYFNGVYGDDCSYACQFVKEYMNDSKATENGFVDPGGDPYKVVITSNAKDNATLTVPGDAASKLTSTAPYKLEADAFDSYTIYIIPGGTCDGETAKPADAIRKFAILYRLEGAGTACLSSDSE